MSSAQTKIDELMAALESTDSKQKEDSKEEESSNNGVIISNGKRKSFFGTTALGGFHKISYVEYGNPLSNKIILCCHGLTRNGLDFDPFAQNLLKKYQNNILILSIDIVGRGESDLLLNSMDYNYNQYVCDVTIWLNKIDAFNKTKDVTWIGTSMGGLIGIMLSCKKYCPFKRLIINDIGPFVSKDILSRLEYASINPWVNTLDEIEKTIKERYIKHFGNTMTDNDWKRLVKNGHIKNEKRKQYRLNYDPSIYDVALKTKKESKNGEYTDVDLWPIWKMVDSDNIKIMILKGEKSDLLTNEIGNKMIETTKNSENVKLIEIKGVGHHPQLKDENEIQIVQKFIFDN